MIASAVLAAFFIVASACTESDDSTPGSSLDTGSSSVTSITAVVSAEPLATEGPTSDPTLQSLDSTIPTLEDLYANVEDGVLRVQATTCAGTGVGTGFLVESELLLTAAHVVAGAVGLAVEHDGEPIAGYVVGADPELEIALVRLDTPIAGHIFRLASEIPGPGADVAAIGLSAPAASDAPGRDDLRSRASSGT